MKLFTIGFTKSTAEQFFERIKRSGARKLVDVRLNNVSQLAGFAKRDDLRYFANEICRIPYEHDLSLAPEQDMLDAYKKDKGDWSEYESHFIALIRSRRIEKLDPQGLDGACLLCSESKPHHCHRRLVAEYLRDAWGDVDVEHL